ncbi:MAG: tetratricopeptide repeat protein [Pseudomonadales bacterium]|nr:tetratricopeptide repeat protein [Pseudomonadales bacterium]
MSEAQHVFDVSVQNFNSEVAERSQKTPVLLEFYADGAEQSQEAAALLARLAGEYEGKFLLGRVDIQRNPELVQQLQVRTLPTVKVVFQGQIVQNLEGPLPEPQLRELLDQLTMSPVERIRAQVDELLEQGDRPAAIQLLQQLIAEEPGNHGIAVELADLLIMEGDMDQAQTMLGGLPGDAEGISKPRNRIAFIEEASSLSSVLELSQSVAGDVDNLRLRYELAVAQVSDDQIEAALENLLVMLQKDRDFEDELARKTMIRIFELLGKGDEIATRYRRKMFTFLH